MLLVAEGSNDYNIIKTRSCLKLAHCRAIFKALYGEAIKHLMPKKVMSRSRV